MLFMRIYGMGVDFIPSWNVFEAQLGVGMQHPSIVCVVCFESFFRLNLRTWFRAHQFLSRRIIVLVPPSASYRQHAAAREPCFPPGDK